MAGHSKWGDLEHKSTPEQMDRARAYLSDELAWFGPDVYGPDWDMPMNCETCADYMLLPHVFRAGLEAAVAERQLGARLAKMKELVEAYHANSHTEPPDS